MQIIQRVTSHCTVSVYEIAQFVAYNYKQLLDEVFVISPPRANPRAFDKFLKYVVNPRIPGGDKIHVKMPRSGAKSRRQIPLPGDT